MAQVRFDTHHRHLEPGRDLLFGSFNVLGLGRGRVVQDEVEVERGEFEGGRSAYPLGSC